MIYLDHHATTPMDPRALKAMQPYFTKRFGNPASLTHAFGREAETAVQHAREEVARLIGADTREIVFTSGATESNNLALKGAAAARREKGDHLVVSSVEHKSVLDVCKRLETEGFRVTLAPVFSDGRVDIEALERLITPKTILISVMLASNEVGMIQPVEAIGRLAQAKGILFHCDAAQGAGKVPIDVKKMGVHFLSFSAHKMYGPKGVGALFVKKSEPGVLLVPQVDGGGQERGLRSGTLNVPGIIGFAEACRLSRLEMKKEAQRVAALRDRLEKGIRVSFPGAVLNGSRKQRLPHNLNLSFPGLEAKELMKRMPHVAVSSGSACTATSIEPSYVLKAMGVRDDLRRSSIRFGLGRFTTKSEIDEVVRQFKRYGKIASHL